MALANDVLESLNKLSNLSKTIKNENDSTDFPPTDDTGSGEPESGGEQTSETGNLDALSEVLTSALSEFGLSSINVTQEEDMDIFADLSFEDGTNLTLQFYVNEGNAYVALLTSDNMESPPEEMLPAELVGEDGSINLSAVNSIPAEEIKELVKTQVTVSNQTEGYRRSRSTNESGSTKQWKKRLSTKFKNENVKLKKLIQNLKSK